MSSGASPPAAGRHARWLLLARVAWVAVATTTLAIVLFSVPSSVEHYRNVCTAASGVCFERTVSQPTPEDVLALREVGLSVSSYALLNVAIDKVFQLVWFAMGALIFWRRSDDLMALLTSLFLVTFGTVTVDTTSADALVSSQPVWWLPVEVVQIMGEIFVVLFFLLFPSGRFVPRWTRRLALAFIAFQVSRDLFPEFYSLSPVLEMVSLGVFLGMLVSLLWSQTYRYRKVSSAAQRRQTRWVVFGTALGVAGTAPFQLPVDLSLVGGDTPFFLLVLRSGFVLSFLLVPLSISVAVAQGRGNDSRPPAAGGIIALTGKVPSAAEDETCPSTSRSPVRRGSAARSEGAQDQVEPTHDHRHRPEVVQDAQDRNGPHGKQHSEHTQHASGDKGPPHPSFHFCGHYREHGERQRQTKEEHRNGGATPRKYRGEADKERDRQQHAPRG